MTKVLRNFTGLCGGRIPHKDKMPGGFNIDTTVSNPFSLAKSIGVRPFLSETLGSAPFNNRFLTTLTLPLILARCKGVWPSSSLELTSTLHDKRTHTANSQPI